MDAMQFQESYPIMYQEIAKSQCSCASMDELVAYFRQKIEADPLGAYIADFDQRAHTMKVGGDVGPAIQAAVNVVFCFGHKLPNPKILAVKPRSIGLADLGETFVISFLRAPNAPAQDTMLEWVAGLCVA